MNVRGEILLMAGVMLPMLSFIIAHVIDLLIHMYSYPILCLNVICYILLLGGAFLAFNGWMTIKKTDI